jgi:dTMP kinase
MVERGKNRFVVLEGNDGSGKGTQLVLLENRLIKNGLSVATYDFPQYESTFFGKLAGRFLSGEFGNLKDVDPHLVALIFAGDRWIAAPKIRRSLDQGKLVISNRYALSNMAHQGAKIPDDKRKGFIDYLDELEYEVYGIPREDLNIILRVNTDTSRKLVLNKERRNYLGEESKRDIQEEDMDHQNKTFEVYGELAEMYPGRIKIINCGDSRGKLMSREEIHELVWDEVDKLIK